MMQDDYSEAIACTRQGAAEPTSLTGCYSSGIEHDHLGVAQSPDVVRTRHVKRTELIPAALHADVPATEYACNPDLSSAQPTKIRPP
jgi:hypothetical protein